MSDPKFYTHDARKAQEEADKHGVSLTAREAVLLAVLVDGVSYNPEWVNGCFDPGNLTESYLARVQNVLLHFVQGEPLRV